MVADMFVQRYLIENDLICASEPASLMQVRSHSRIDRALQVRNGATHDSVVYRILSHTRNALVSASPTRLSNFLLRVTLGCAPLNPNLVLYSPALYPSRSEYPTLAMSNCNV